MSLQSIQLSSFDLVSGEPLSDIFIVAHYPESGSPQIYDVRCKAKAPGQAAACRILLSTENGAITLMQQGKIKWTRQEALTNIVSIEMIDLPLSDAEGSIENELKNKDGKHKLHLFDMSQIFYFNNHFTCTDLCV